MVPAFFVGELGLDELEVGGAFERGEVGGFGLVREGSHGAAHFVAAREQVLDDVGGDVARGASDQDGVGGLEFVAHGRGRRGNNMGMGWGDIKGFLMRRG